MKWLLIVVAMISGTGGTPPGPRIVASSPINHLFDTLQACRDTFTTLKSIPMAEMPHGQFVCLEIGQGNAVAVGNITPELGWQSIPAQSIPTQSSSDPDHDWTIAP
jgi:hypothetical protein